MSGELEILVFKEGALAAVGHDLKLRGTCAVTVDRTARTVRAIVDASSLRVVAAQRDGRDDPAALSASDRAKIEASTRDDVLEARRHPQIVFEGRWVGDAPADVEGTLALHGRSLPLRLVVRADGDHVVAEATLRQSAFGITPFRALLGALRVQDGVRVRWSGTP